MATDCNEDERTSDFFKAFLYSLRSTCFQFLDFKEHVSIRGFLAIDVDGQEQQHYVLSEVVSRKKASKMTSFPLEVVISSKSLDHDLASSCKKPKKNVLSLQKPRRASRSDTSKIELGQKTKVVGDKGNITKQRQSPSDVQPPRPYVSQSVRSDPSNSTFTMEHGISAVGRNRKPTFTGTGGKHLRSTTYLSNSTTAAISRNPSAPQKRIGPIKTGCNVNTSFSKRIRNTTHSISRNSSLIDHSVSRKRPHKSSSASSDSTYCIFDSLESGNGSSESCEDNTAYPPRSGHDENTYNKEQSKIEQMEQINKVSSASQGECLPIDSSYHFDKFFACCDSDQDCSITSVKPRYLVGHSMT